MSSPATQTSLRMRRIIVFMRCYILLIWVFSCVYTVLGVALHWSRSIRLVQDLIIIVFVHILSYDTFEEITMLHEIQIEEPLRWIVEARNFAVASFSFYCVRRVARASPLGSRALCLSWLPPYVITAPKSRRSAQTSRIISVFSGNFESPHPTPTHTHAH